jgi:hypothetical protein
MLKKIVLSLVAALALNVGIGFAAPINDLATGQTAVGIGSDTFYLEHQLTDNFTLGFQNVDRGDNGSSLDDIYGQFRLSGNLRAIVGSRNFDFGSKLYGGLAVSGPMAPEWDGYASFVAGDQFKELQVGANFHLAHNVDLNVNYHSFMPDAGRDTNGVGVGATFKF